MCRCCIAAGRSVWQCLIQRPESSFSLITEQHYGIRIRQMKPHQRAGAVYRLLPLLGIFLKSSKLSSCTQSAEPLRWCHELLLPADISPQYPLQSDPILLLLNPPAAGGSGARAVPAAGRFIPT